MEKVSQFIKEELSGWKLWEVVWLFSACAVIAALSVYWHDSFMGIISATTGVACVVCTGKGKLSAYIFGAVNVVLYAIISFHAKYYGEVMLNSLYYFPMQFYGFYVWNKHMNKETHEVEKKRMTKTGRGKLLFTNTSHTQKGVKDNIYNSFVEKNTLMPPITAPHRSLMVSSGSPAGC